MTNATLWCWGTNRNGELGDGTTVDGSVPVQTGQNAYWANVSAGAYHTCGLRTDGTLWCWGDTSVGQLGVGTTLYAFIQERQVIG